MPSEGLNQISEESISRTATILAAREGGIGFTAPGNEIDLSTDSAKAANIDWQQEVKARIDAAGQESAKFNAAIEADKRDISVVEEDPWQKVGDEIEEVVVLAENKISDAGAEIRKQMYEDKVRLERSGIIGIAYKIIDKLEGYIGKKIATNVFRESMKKMRLPGENVNFMTAPLGENSWYNVNVTTKNKTKDSHPSERFAARDDATNAVEGSYAIQFAETVKNRLATIAGIQSRLWNSQSRNSR